MRFDRASWFVVVLTSLAPNVAAQVIFVDDSASPPHDGTSWTNAFTTLQEAIDEFSANPLPGTKILVAEGTYVPTEPAAASPINRTFDLPSGIEIRGGFLGAGGSSDPDLPDGKFKKTILSGDHGGGLFSQNVIICDDPSFIGTVRIRGLKIANGKSNVRKGGGIRCRDTNLWLDDVTFEDNESVAGGALYFQSSNLYMTTPVEPILNLRRCRFAGNMIRDTGPLSREGGGAIMCDGSGAIDFMMDVRLANVEFAENVCENNLADTDTGGGAIFLKEVYNFSGQNLLFYGNQCWGRGGAVAVSADAEGEYEIHRWQHCTFYGNEAGLGSGSSVIDGSAIAVDEAAAHPVGHQYGIGNSIFWGHKTPGGPSISSATASSILVLQHSDVNPQPGGGNGYTANWGASPQSQGIIALNPRFVNTSSDNYRLQTLPPFLSPCVDAGVSGAAGADPADLDEDGATTGVLLPFDLDLGARIQGAPATIEIDMGAYEAGFGFSQS